MSKIKVYKKDGSPLYDLDDSKEIARGGEGFLLPVPGNKKMVAKIYHQGCVSITEPKFTYLNRLDNTFFIKPLELLYDKSRMICGITMEFLSSDFYPLDTLFNKNFCLKNVINSPVKEKIAKQLIAAVKSAHNIQVNIGDLSGLNVMTNNKGEIKFIDVDSYEVPGIKHTNKLLEDIRDYLYGSHVSVNSDFFALSVIIFNYITYLHPFKGVHKKIPKMAERMIRKIPVFLNDPDLIIPKCYEVIKDKFLQDQFEGIYIRGERFLLSVDKLAQPLMGKKVQPQTIQEADVMLLNVVNQKEIEYAYFSNIQGMIRTSDEYLIYDTSTRGAMYLKATLKRTEYVDVFVGAQNIITVVGNKLFEFNKISRTSTPITNLTINPKARFIHLGDYIMMIEEDAFYKIYLDEIKYGNIKYERTSAFGPGFMTHNGMIQNVGGVHYVHYNVENYLSLTPSPVNLHGVFQQKDIGIAQYTEKQHVKFKFYNINKGQFTFYQETDSFSNFAYKGTNMNDANIFQPKDNIIEVLRGLDLYKIAEIKCSLVSTDTKLYCTNAGIVVINEDEAWLLNKN